VSFAAMAVEPDEVLSDPNLEARARVLSKELRCAVCRNENIDSSNAGIARDLRMLVRERLVAGDTDEQVMAQVVGRYGEFVLLKPTKTGANLILWIFGPLSLLTGLVLSILFLRRSGNKAPKCLSEDEEHRLNELLKSD
jgi:cytochrome c-type biogenesis protein CcmH